MQWIKSSLNRKFIVGTASGLLVSTLVFLFLFANMYNSEVEKQRAETVSQINRLLRTSLENAMLKRDLEGLQDIVRGLGRQSDIDSVMILNPAGQIRFSNDPQLFGKMIPDETKVATTTNRFIELEDGKEVLRSTHPVNNRKPCDQCHGPVDKNPVNGILIVDYDAAPIRTQAAKTTLILMGSGALIVLINLAGGWWFIRRFVLRPIDQLASTSHRLAGGNLDARVELEGNDELAVLGKSFNRMAGNLREKLLELEEKEAFLQALVDAIPDGIRVIGEDYRILLTNNAYREQLGLKESGTRGIECYRSSHGRIEPCAPTLTTCPMVEIGKSDEPLKTVHRHTRDDGSDLDVEIYASSMHVTLDGKPHTLVVESIRDLEKEVRFSQEQRLSELGMLAAGVAHEIHNPLASVRLALHAAHDSLEDPGENEESAVELIDIVDREIDICIDVTERLLRLSDPPPEERELVDINRSINDTLSLLRWEAENGDISIEIDTPEISPRTLATSNDIGMAALNLAQNAFHAMPDGGSLRVSIGVSDGWIEIRFADTGTGIDDETMEKIFYPFFSRRANHTHGLQTES